MRASRKVLFEVYAERLKQHEQWGDQSLLPIGLPVAGTAEFLAKQREIVAAAEHAGILTFDNILGEEYLEVLAARTPEEQRLELIQLAAVCVQIVEVLDRRRECGST